MTQSTVSPVSRKIAHHGTARRGANAIVLFLKDVYNDIPNVTVIIDDENMLRLAGHSSITCGTSHEG